jgi:CubicO group peptidase (beta-lactamase class C family)
MHVLTFLGLVLTVSAFASPTDEFREFVVAEMERFGIPGTSIALVDEGVVQYISLGVRRAGESGDVSSADPFNVGSVSKTISAWAVMRLAEQGAVSLDTPVQELLGQRWRLPESGFDHQLVTLRRILSHTAGLSAPSYQGFPPGSAPVTLEDSLDGIPLASSAVRVVAAPGSSFRYSGGGFSVAQLVIETVTGRSFPEFVTNELFAPLGMGHAMYLTFEAEPLAVSPHDYAGRPILDYRMPEHAAGGLRASAEDLARFLMANMDSNPVLAEQSVAALHEAVVSAGRDVRFTLGFERLGGLLSHGGHARGWVASISFHPSSNSGLVVLTNSAGGIPFVENVRCKWSELFAIHELARHCERRLLTDRVTHWGLVALSFAALILAIGIAARAYRRLGSRAARISFSAKRVARGLVLLVSIGTVWAVLGTELGVYLASGVRWGLPTIHFLPDAALYAAVAVTVLLAVMTCTCFVARETTRLA